MPTHDAQFKRIALGIGMVLVSTELVAALILAYLGLALLPALGVASPSVMQGLAWLLRFTVPILVTAFILQVVGPSLCLAAPREARVSEILLAAVAANALALGAEILSSFWALPVWLGGASGLLFLSGNILFVWFLKRLSDHLNHADNSKLAVSTLRLGLIAIVVAMVVIVTGRLVVRGFAPGALPWGTIFLVSMLVLLVIILLAVLRYSRLLVYTRAGVLRFLQEQR
jgi:hypothetical protein